MTRRSFSIVEVMVALGVLTLAVLATMAALGQSSQLRMTSAESEDASQALQAQVAAVRMAGDVASVVALDGAVFTPTSINLRDPIGTIEVMNEADCSAEFLADLDRDPLTGFDAAGHDFYDLDSDGTPGEGDVTTPGDTATGSLLEDYENIIPIRLTLTWTTATNDTRQMTVMTFVYPVSTQ